MIKTKLMACMLFLTFLLLPSTLTAQDIPTTPRSREAIARVRPALEAALNKAAMTWGSPIFIRIFKWEMILELWLQTDNGFSLFRTYDICTCGPMGLGPKTRQGDWRAPEGFYFVAPRQLNPASRFHLSFNIGYPNAYERAHDWTGSALMVHGDCVSIGCYAMTDKAIEEIYALADGALRNGQRFFRVHIFPFRMTDRNMRICERSTWYDFWENLKEGYDFFVENGHTPPNVVVRNGRYAFEPSQ